VGAACDWGIGTAEGKKRAQEIVDVMWKREATGE
jgi:hypothetical protein